VSYVGVDLFEDRSTADAAAQRISLKAAHRLLCSSGARVRLLPGDPYSVLARAANHLGKADLVVVSSELPGHRWPAPGTTSRDSAREIQVFAERTAGPTGETRVCRLSLDQVDCWRPGPRESPAPPEGGISTSIAFASEAAIAQAPIRERTQLSRSERRHLIPRGS